MAYIEYPEGTAIEKTNAITKQIEQEMFRVIQQSKYIMDGANVMLESGVAQEKVWVTRNRQWGNQ